MPSLVQAAAIDRLYKAARSVKDASDTDTLATAEQELDQAVREALKVSVSGKKIQQITGISKGRIQGMRPPLVPKPRPEDIVLDGSDWGFLGPPEWTPPTPRIRIVSGGLPGHGKRR